MVGSSNFSITVPVDRSLPNSNNLKGKSFQILVKKFLETQNYDVIEEVRNTGSEIDLLCKSSLNGETLIVECKARNENVNSEAVNKLHADVDLRSAQKGYIFSISPIGGEARTRLDDFNQKYNGRYSFISPEKLIVGLLNSKLLKLPDGAENDTHREFTLCVFGRKLIWIEVASVRVGSAPSFLRGWDAETGLALATSECPDLSATDFSHPDLPWQTRAVQNEERRELQSVVEVIPGEEWSDYRPSRPNDFVGRQQVILDIYNFFDKVRKGETRSRLFGVKGKSGWGKSSLALKLASDFSANKIVLIPVDCRSAINSTYPDLVIARTLRAISDRINPGPLFDFRPSFNSNPFDDEAAISLLRNASRAGFLVGVIFDQFEAVIHRKELEPAFERMRELALACEEAQLPFVVGFSWKTDGTVGSDYPGYHLWHSLSDHRRDFEIDRFTREDADQFLHLAQRESGKSLKPQIKKFIIEHYAGFPWLLKKLTRHYIERSKLGSDGTGASLVSLEELFKSDIEELPANQLRALKFIAQSSPVDYGSVSERFGDDSVVSLIDNRLIINTGGQLNLYWDIFRDYILYDQVPHLPNTFVPSISMRKIRSALNYLVNARASSYEDLAHHLGISLSTADNVVRDLANFGLVAPNRQEQQIDIITDDPKKMTGLILEFLRSHAVFVASEKIVSGDGSANLHFITDMVSKDYEFISIDQRTLENYIRKILTYCLSFGLLVKDGKEFRLGEPVVDILDETDRLVRVTEVDLFRASAPPERVLELMQIISRSEGYTFEQASDAGLRNSVFAARALNIVIDTNQEILLNRNSFENLSLDEILRTAACSVEPFKSALVGFDTESLPSEQIGIHINDFFGLNWTPASCKRYGSGYKRWLMFLS